MHGRIEILFYLFWVNCGWGIKKKKNKYELEEGIDVDFFFCVLLLCPGWEKKKLSGMKKSIWGLGGASCLCAFCRSRPHQQQNACPSLMHTHFLFFVPFFFFLFFFLFVKLFSLFFAAKFQTRLTITLLIPFYIYFMFYELSLRDIIQRFFMWGWIAIFFFFLREFV